MTWIALAALALVIVGVVAFPRIGRSPAASAQPATAGAAQVRTDFIAPMKSSGTTRRADGIK